MVIISISGSAGSGKSTIGRLLAQRLNITFYSIGDIRRKYSLDHGMSIEELNANSEDDPTSDHLIDEYQKKLSMHEQSFIIDARLAFHFIPESIKVFISVSKETGAMRIFNAHRTSEAWNSIEEGIEALKRREESDRRRYMKFYGVNPYDLSQFDLVVSTEKISAEECVEHIMKFLNCKEVI